MESTLTVVNAEIFALFHRFRTLFSLERTTHLHHLSLLLERILLLIPFLPNVLDALQFENVGNVDVNCKLNRLLATVEQTAGASNRVL